jgi:cell division protein ZapA
MSDLARVVSVEILGMRYPIRSALDPSYVMELAAYVDAKMIAASDEGGHDDSLKIAVLAALNIADELFRLKNSKENISGIVDRKADELIKILDKAISA